MDTGMQVHTAVFLKPEFTRLPGNQHLSFLIYPPQFPETIFSFSFTKLHQNGLAFISIGKSYLGYWNAYFGVVV